MHIIPNQGVCDPHIHIYNGKAYLFSTHDRGPGNPIYRMDDWQIFSSEDLLNWKLEYVLHPEDTFLGKCEECYATDAAERNGKYYFYFSNQQICTGVAVSENGPAGPYKDALGKPLLPQGLVDTPSYDPSVFIDDDENKTPYIIWGYTCFGKKYHIARLNEDMISLAEEPRPIEIVNSWPSDAAWVWKRGGLYYMTTHRSWYATAENIYGPYTYRGRFCFDAEVDHACVFEYRNQTYLAYGVTETAGKLEHDPYYRTTKLIYAHYKDNGDLTCDEFIQKVGVGQYDASWDRIKGEWYFEASDELYKKENGNGFDIRGIRDGSYLYYQNVNGMEENALMFICAADKGGSNCVIEVRENAPDGKLLGSCEVKNAGNFAFDSYGEIPCRLENTAGTHSLCFVFRGSGEDILHFDSFRFDKDGYVT